MYFPSGSSYIKPESKLSYLEEKALIYAKEEPDFL